MRKREEKVAKGIKKIKRPDQDALLIYVLKYYFSAFFVTSNMIGVAMKIEA